MDNENIIKLQIPNNNKNSIIENTKFTDNEGIEESLKKLEDISSKIQESVLKNNPKSNVINFEDLKKK